jgi:hypothetical protein
MRTDPLRRRSPAVDVGTTDRSFADMFERRLPTTTHSSFTAASAFFPVSRSQSDSSPRTIRQAIGVLLTSMKIDALTADLTTNQLYVRRACLCCDLRPERNAWFSLQRR